MNQIDGCQEPGNAEPIEQQITSAQAFLAVILTERTGPLTGPQRDMLDTIAETLDRISRKFPASAPKATHVPSRCSHPRHGAPTRSHQWGEES